MTEPTAPAVIQPTSNAVAHGAFLSPESWKMLKELGDAVVKSGLAPKEVKTGEAAAIIMLKGHELGISPMEALQLIHVVNNKPGLSAKFILALIRKRYPHARIEIERRDETGTVLWAGRPGQKDLTRFSFTMADARRAGLANKDTYKGYPTRMCYWRAIADMADALFPECTMSERFTGPVTIDLDDDDENTIVPVVKREPPQIPGDHLFDGSAPHVTRAKEMLTTAKVPEEFWNETLARAKGRRGSELVDIARQVMNEHDRQA